jgi:hypothetical protein
VSLLTLALAVNAVLLLAPPWWIERHWMAGPWAWWPAVTARLHALLPLPLTLTVLALGVAGALAWALARPPRLRRSLLALASGAVLLAATFVPAWGVAYRRVPLAATLQLEPEGVGREALLVALERLAELVAQSAPAQPLAVLADDAALAAAVAAAARCVADADELVTGRRVALPAAVRTLPAGSFLRAGYAGIALPWLLEPHVDAGLAPAARLGVAAHELAHAAGWARESDTDVLAILAGLGCDHPWVRYASALRGVQALQVALRPLAPDGSAHRARMSAALASLPQVAHEDRAAQQAAARQWYAPALAQAVSGVYDGYLRSQGVREGIADYDAAGALLGAALAACGPEADVGWCR